MLASVLVLTSALAALDVDVGAHVEAAVINESGTNSALFLGMGPSLFLRLYAFGGWYAEPTLDLAPGLVRASVDHIDSDGGTWAEGMTGGVGVIVGHELTLDSGLLVKAGLGPWIGIAPYSCGDCFFSGPAPGAVAEVVLAVPIAKTGVRLESALQLSLAFPTALSVRATARSGVSFIFGA